MSKDFYIDTKREGLARVECIAEVMAHPNADRLDIVTVNEWNCVVSKDSFKVGDMCIFFEIDSILPMEVERRIFGEDSKIKLKNSRVRTIKIRQAVSQGLVVSPEAFVGMIGEVNVGDDLTQILNIGKKVPVPQKGNLLHVQVGPKRKNTNNPNFDRMRKPVHYKRVGGFPDEDVFITEKIHGTSFVAGWVERPQDTFAEKLNALLFGEYQFCYRSMNLQLQGEDSLWVNILKKVGLRKEKPMEDTLYGRMCLKYNLKDILGKGIVITGEIYGDGVQKGYKYGCKAGEQKLVGFGVRLNGKECDPQAAHLILNAYGIPTVPVLYTGTMPDKKTVQELSEGPSILDPKTKVREGCVINSSSGEKSKYFGTALVKSINPEYLLKNNTEFN